jgi:anti-sigma B factor antagonist
MEFYYAEMDKDVLIVRADGALNSDTADRFVDQLGGFIDSGLTKIIVDCSELEQITSYGLGVLVRLHGKLAKRGGDVKLACVGGLVEQVLTVTRLTSLFRIYPDVNAARLSFPPSLGGNAPAGE